MTALTTLSARAQGLSSHLLGRTALESLAQASDLPAFTRALARLGPRLEPVGDTADLLTIERAVRRTASQYLRTLARWEETPPGVLDLFFAQQERRALRSFLRGALQGAPAEARLAGLLSTPRLPERALLGLARMPTPRAVVALLRVLGHPDAARLAPLTAETNPTLLRLDAALLEGWAERAHAAARDDVLRAWVRSSLDVANAQDALLLCGGPRETEPAPYFVAGGRALDRETFLSVAQAASRADALTLLRQTSLSPLLPLGADDAAHFERAFLSQTLTQLRHTARLEPLSAAPLLLFLLRLEAQSRDLRTLAWGAELHAPPALRLQDLVTSWN